MFYIAVTIIIAGQITTYGLSKSFDYREKCETHIEALIEQWRQTNKKVSIEFECRKHMIYNG